MSGFKWTLDWDTNPLRRGGQVAADAVDTAIDEFSKLATDADRATGKAGDSLGNDVKDGGRTAERALSDLEAAFRETARKAQEKTRDTGRSLGDDVKEGAGRASEGVQSFKEESVQNFSEVASSFTGDMSQAADGVQGILGGLASSIPGPVGLISGILAGVGGAMLQSFISNSDASKQKVQDMFDDMAANASSFVSSDYFSTAIKAVVDDTKQYAQAQQIASASGLTLGTVLRGMAGDTEAAQRVTQALEDQYGGLADEIGNASDFFGRAASGLGDYTDAQRKGATATDEWRKVVDTNNASMDTARARYDSYQQAVDGLSGAFDRTTDSAGRVSQGIGQIPTNVTVKLAVDDSAVQAWARRPVQINAVARVGTPQAM